MAVRGMCSKQCKYIGSVAVTTMLHEERVRFVKRKMTDSNGKCRGVKVVLSITGDGIKVYNETQTAVKMAHLITWVTFSTCHALKRIFTYVARTKRADGSALMQAHMFRTKRSAHCELLNKGMTQAFDEAFSRSTQDRRDFACENKHAMKPREAKGGKQWAKLDQANGHRQGHASWRNPSENSESSVSEGDSIHPNNNFDKPANDDDLFLADDKKPTNNSKAIRSSKGRRKSFKIFTLPRKLSDTVFVGTHNYENVEDYRTERLQSVTEGWYKALFTRELAENYLQHAPVGSFIVRDSSTHLHAYILTVKVPIRLKPNGFANFIIVQKSKNKVKIKGFSQAFASIADLVGFYVLERGEMPCTLRVFEGNPMFLERGNDSDSEDEDEYDDPDYALFESTQIMQELDRIS